MADDFQALGPGRFCRRAFWSPLTTAILLGDLLALPVGEHLIFGFCFPTTFRRVSIWQRAVESGPPSSAISAPPIFLLPAFLQHFIADPFGRWRSSAFSPRWLGDHAQFIGGHGRLRTF